jgi:hypothetical protein
MTRRLYTLVLFTVLAAEVAVLALAVATRGGLR